MTDGYIRALIPTLTFAYFWLWATYSNWDVHFMIFHSEPQIWGAVARLAVGSLLIVSTIFSFIQQK